MNSKKNSTYARLSSKLATFIALIIPLVFTACDDFKPKVPDVITEEVRDITGPDKVTVEVIFPDGTLSLRVKGEKGQIVHRAQTGTGRIIRIIKLAEGQRVKAGDEVMVLLRTKTERFKDGKSFTKLPIVWEVWKKGAVGVYDPGPQGYGEEYSPLPVGVDEYTRKK